MKSKKKKIVFLLLTMILVWSLCACGNDSGEKKNSKLSSDDVVKKIEKSISKYNDGEISYDDAVEDIMKFQEKYPEIVSEQNGKIGELKKSKASYEEAMDKYKNEKYEECIKLFNNVIVADVNYEDAQEKIKESTKLYQEYVDNQIEQALEDKDFSTAYTLLDKSESILDEDIINAKKKEIEEAKEIVISEALAKAKDDAENAIAAGQYTDAIQISKKLYNEYGNSDAIKTFVAEVQDKVINDSIAEAEKLLKEYKIDEAVGTARKYEHSVDDASKLLAEVERIESYRPTRLMDMEVFYNESGKGNIKRELWGLTDVTNSNEDGFEGIMYDATHSLILKEYIYYYEEQYLLNNGYSRFKAKFVLNQENKNTKGSFWLEFYCDEQLVHKTDILSGGKMPIDIDVDVSEVGNFKVIMRVTGEDNVGQWSSYYDGKVGLVDALLYKKID